MIAKPLPDTVAVTITRQTLAKEVLASSSSLQSADRDDPDLRISAAGATPEAGSTNGTSATPTPTAAPGTKPDCDTSHSSLYCVYTIEEGDTLSKIAEKFGLKGNDEVTPWELLVQSNKPDITSEDDILQPDQKLRIPANAAAASALSPEAGTKPGSSVLHTVLKDETLSDIAGDYDVDVDDIVNANNLSDPDSLAIGDELLIPHPQRLLKPAPAPATAATAPTSSGSGSTQAAAPSVPKSSAGFIWPTSGPISSYFGPSHPLGIDVDLYANPNAPIAAAAGGTVTFAGGNSCCSYGLYVVVNHGNGFQTLYAHLSSISVGVGQKVSQGALVGRGGRTGYATGNHLHFEVQLNGSTVNPTAYLP